MALSWAAKEMGDTKTLDRLTNEMIRLGEIGEKLGVASAGNQVTMAYLGALKGGDPGEVTTRLQRAVELGFLNSGRLTMQPWWGAYREDPEFQAILEDIRKRQTRQLNALRAEGL